MNEALTLDVSPRTVIGKQVKQLRRAGIIPGVIYGPTRPEPTAIQVDWITLRPVLIKAGSTHLITLNLEGQPITVLVREVHRHPIKNQILNIDFYAADVNATLKTIVPILVPDVEAQMKRLGARILQVVASVEVESLPADIPENITIDLSTFNNVRNIRFKDLIAPTGTTFLVDEDTVVVRIFTGASEDEVEEEYTGEIGEVEVIGRGARDEEDFED